uniref:Legume lectin domain-containing protein n=1 Tax=Tetradesmus obliquus TaxID=3088 RepID=A0A383VJA4_TETOB|eukprot:jgi/Sobl393_1/7576/SZX64456.1
MPAVQDYAAKVLSIYYSTDSTKPGSPCTTWSLDLPKYFGTPNLYLGFSAATGYFANNHYIAGVEFTY